LKEHWSRAAIIRGKDTQKPVVVPVVLHHGHYFALRLPALRKAWPREWCNTKEDEKVAFTQDIDNTQELSTICRGGKEGEVLEEICLADWSADASGSTEDVPRDIGLTNRLRGGAKDADEDAEVEDLLKPFDEKAFCTPKKNRSNGKHDEEMLKSFSTRRTASTKRSADSLLKSFRTVSTSKKPRPGRIGVNLHKKKHNTWTCPVCSEVVEITDRKKGLSYIGSHLKKFHFATFQSALTENSKRHRWGSGLGLRGLVRAIPFQVMEKSRWKEEAEYVCPYCDEALPKLAGKKTNSNDTRGYLLRFSKKQHLRFDCKFRKQKKDITMRQYYKDYMAKYGLMLFNHTESYMKSKYVKKAEENGHKLALFDFEKRDTTWQGKLCTVCTQCRKYHDMARYPCKGVAGRKPWNPGFAFWKAVRANKQCKVACEKLQMTQSEVIKATKIAEAFCSKRGGQKRTED